MSLDKPTEYQQSSIAVIGMSGRFPGAEDVSLFWQNLLNGVESIQVLSADELTAAGVSESLQNNPDYRAAASFIESHDCFDPGFFNIQMAEARVMDPQHRLALQSAWHTIENAGYDANAYNGAIGVFAGSGGIVSSQILAEHVLPQDEVGRTGGSWHLGNDKDFVPTRISYKLNLTGPSVTIQTACSTSLVAVHLACQSIRNHESDMALAGAVCVRTPQKAGYMIENGGIFSVNGQMRAFDQDAQGVVFGSGVSFILLKSLERAIADKDNICAVIRGSALNNDGGNKMSYMATKQSGQVACVVEALKNAGVKAQQLGYLESHGTGTAMGDPVEHAALATAFAVDTDQKQFCALGAVKNNVGHLDIASGMASLIKVILSLQSGQIAPCINYQQANKKIRFEQGPFYINTKIEPWAQDKPRLAAINSLGIGGTNAFMILEQAPKIEALPVSNKPQLIVISAKTNEALKQKYQDLVNWLDNHDSIQLADLAFTLGIGREHFDLRCAMVIDEIGQLKTNLQRLIKKRRVKNCFIQSSEKRQAAFSEGLIDFGQQLVGQLSDWLSADNHEDGIEKQCQESLVTLADLYSRGAKLDFAPLYANQNCRRIVLPGYPFVQTPIEPPQPIGQLIPASAAKSASNGYSDAIHPLLQRNISDLGGLKFQSTFDGEEFFLADHVIDGSKIFPGVAYLEMAWTAGQQVLGEQDRQHRLKLSNVVWSRPAILHHQALVLKLELLPGLSNQPMQFQISELTDTSNICCQGSLSLSAQPSDSAELLDIKAKLDAMSQSKLSADQCYQHFDERGFNYGIGFTSINEVYHQGEEVFAKVVLASKLHQGAEQFTLHPSLLDGALQTSMLFAGNDNKDSKPVPFELAAVDIIKPCDGELWVHMRRVYHGSDTLQRFDVDMYSLDGQLAISIGGYSTRHLSTSVTADNNQTLLFEPHWQALTSDVGQNRSDNFERKVLVVLGRSELTVEQIEAQLSGYQVKNLTTESYQQAAEQLLVLLQQLTRDAGQVLFQLLVVNTAQLIGFNGLSAMLKTAQIECSGLSAQLIEWTDQDLDLPNLQWLSEHLQNLQMRQLADIRIIEQQIQQRVWLPLVCEGEQKPWRSNGVYLITGGASGIGSLFATDIANTAPGASIILLGRSAPSEDTQKLLSELSKTVTVEYCQSDVSDINTLQTSIDEVTSRLGSLTGIIHSAGVIDDGLMKNKTKEAQARVLAPKVAGLEALDQVSANMALDFLLLFSSLTSVQGNIGQIDYAAANGFMDSFVEHRNQLVDDGQRQGKSLAINWPLWQQGSMSIDESAQQQMFRQMGQVVLDTPSGLQACYQALNSKASQVLVLKGDKAKINAVVLTQAEPLIAESLVADSAADATASMSSEDSQSGSLAAINQAAKNQSTKQQLSTALLKHLTSDVASLLGVDTDDLDPEAEFSEFGFDSISLTGFANRVNKHFNLGLMPTAFFEYPNLNEMAKFLVQSHEAELTAVVSLDNSERSDIEEQALEEKESGTSQQQGAQDTQQKAQPTSASANIEPFEVNTAWPTGFDLPLIEQQLQPTVAAKPQAIAIVGVSGSFPESANIDELWANLVAEKDCISEIPASRWDWRDIYGDPASEGNCSNIKWGGFLAGVDKFDPLFFAISPKEAQLMDPHQRLLMLHGWAAIEDAGYAGASLAGSNMGVFLATNASGYDQLIEKARLDIEPYSATGHVPSVGPHRLSYFLDVHGPSVPIETACSSSLIAIHRAVQSIHNGSCDSALAGGVQIIVSEAMHISFNKAGMLSEDGRCKTFSAQANGYVRGEGVGVMLLKTLSAAQSCGDHIYGLIRGSAENHGGRANSLTAPNPKAQAQLLKTAYRQAGFDPATIGYIEAHGTGTELGDPIEINGLKAAFRDLYADFDHQKPSNSAISHHCGLGTIKSNIGHLELAAGIAGVIKVLLQFKHQTLVKSLHCEQLNPYIDFKDSPFYVVQKIRQWQPLKGSNGKDLPRRAGVSSFGFGGANAHVVLEEYIAPAEPSPSVNASTSRVLVILSAKSEQQLHQRAAQLQLVCEQHLASTPASISTLNLTDLAYTLQVGRDAMDYRFAVVVDSQAQLTASLSDFLAKQNNDGCFYGHIKTNKQLLAGLGNDEDMAQTLKAWLNKGKLEKVAKLWVKGLTVDWSLLYPDSQPQRLSLPTYPFAQESYWVPHVSSRFGAGKNRNEGKQLNPLLHENRSGFDHVGYRSVFTGKESFISAGQMQPWAQMEMARLAVLACQTSDSQTDHTTGISEQNRHWCCIDMVWSQPINIDTHTPVYIDLYQQKNNQVGYEIYLLDDNAVQSIHAQGACIDFTEQQPTLDLAARRQVLTALELNANAKAWQADNELLLNYSQPQALATLAHVEKLTEYVALWLANNGLSEDTLHSGAIGKLIVYHANCAADESLWCQLSLIQSDNDCWLLDVTLTNQQGVAYLQIHNWQLQRVVAQAESPKDGLVKRMLMTTDWRPCQVLDSKEQPPQNHHVFMIGWGEQQAQSISAGLSATIHLVDIDTEDMADSFGEIALNLFEFIKTQFAAGLTQPLYLQLLVSGDEDQRAPLIFGLSGLLKSAQLENPLLRTQLLSFLQQNHQLPSSEQIAALLLDNLHDGAPLVRYHNNQRAVWQLQLAKAHHIPLVFKEGGVYWITGGGGALGILIAKQLASQLSQVTLILSGRSPNLTAKTLDSLKADGVTIDYHCVEISDSAAVDYTLAKIIGSHGELNGIIHCAGIIRDNFVLKKDAKQFDRVLQAKVAGLHNLDRACSEIPLDMMLLFSSTSSVFGNAGQTDYAAANGFMDGFALWRQQQVKQGNRFGRTVSINWPLWREGGMQLDDSIIALMMAEKGLGVLETEQGYKALLEALTLQTHQVAVLCGDTNIIGRKLLAHQSLEAVNSKAPEALESEVTAVDQKQWRDKVLLKLKALLSELTGLAVSKISAHNQLENYGIDSLLVNQLNRRFNDIFGGLSKTIMFEYHTLGALSDYFCQHHLQACIDWCAADGDTQPTAPEKSTAFSPKALGQLESLRNQHHVNRRPLGHSLGHKLTERQPIAIIGMAGRYPQAPDLHTFWAKLCDGYDAITEIPASRWSADEWFIGDQQKAIDEGGYYAKWGGFIDNFSAFDPSFFNISPLDAYGMDPQERLFVENCWHTLEDGGYTKGRLKSAHGGNVGVFVGVTKTGYEHYGPPLWAQGKHLHPHTSFSSVANRVSYLLDLKGPSMPIDTMCSSSLTAIHEACEHLQRGECEIALAGGVNLYLHPSNYVSLSALRMLSPTGRCHSFGAKGDGFVPGEGVGTVLLKPLSDALRDNDRIYAQIIGSAINHGGKTNGYTVPNPTAHAELIGLALSKANIDARTIGYIEAHGTGTSLGDPIEVSGLTQAFIKHTRDENKSDRGYCALGSLKSNIGHLEAAAGVAGLTKVVLQMQHRRLLASLHAKTLNPNIDFGQTPFVVQQSMSDWSPMTLNGQIVPRRAGISSFGAGGANAHVILEEYQSVVTAQQQNQPLGEVIILLSARSQKQLMLSAELLKNYTANYQDSQLADLAYTLQVGREQMKYRLALSVSSVDKLNEKLCHYLANPSDQCAGMYTGHSTGETFDESVEDIDQWLQTTVRWFANNDKQLLSQWVAGRNVDWAQLYGNKPMTVLSAPGYPFTPDTFWLPELDKTKPQSQSLPENAIEPQAQPIVVEDNKTDSKAKSTIEILVPNWEALDDMCEPSLGDCEGFILDAKTLLVGNGLPKGANNAQCLDFNEINDIATIEHFISELRQVQRVIWIAGCDFDKSDSEQFTLRVRQQIVKQLISQTLDHKLDQELRWTVITVQCCNVFDDDMLSAKASRESQIISQTVKESEQWNVCKIDIESKEQTQQAIEFSQHIAQANGQYALRMGFWYEQQYIALAQQNLLGVQQNLLGNGEDSVSPVQAPGRFVYIGQMNEASFLWCKQLLENTDSEIVWLASPQNQHAPYEPDTADSAMLQAFIKLRLHLHYVAMDWSDEQPVINAVKQAFDANGDNPDAISGIISNYSDIAPDKASIDTSATQNIIGKDTVYGTGFSNLLTTLNRALQPTFILSLKDQLAINEPANLHQARILSLDTSQIKVWDGRSHQATCDAMSLLIKLQPLRQMFLTDISNISESKAQQGDSSE